MNKLAGKNRTYSLPDPSKSCRMQTIKRVIVLVLVATAVFVIVGLNNIRSQDKFAARLRSGTLATVAQAGATGGKAADQVADGATNAIHQARHKIGKRNL